ncbi:hypothetical protein IFM89_011719, partial [Coptis chinensis]
MDVTSPHSTDWRGGLGDRGNATYSANSTFYMFVAEATPKTVFLCCPSVYSLIAFRILVLICCVGFGQGHLPRLLDCFLTFSGYTRLLRFDMDDGAITISLPCGRKFSYWEGPFWVMPNCEPQDEETPIADAIAAVYDSSKD